MEDIRNHDATPTTEETAWLRTSAVNLVFRAVMVAGVALTIGTSASLLLEASEGSPRVADAAAK